MKIAGIALITVFLTLLLKEQKPNFAVLLVLFVSVGIFLFLIDQIQSIIQMIREIASKTDINMVYVETILKIIGIAYIAELASQISKDAGLSSLASKVELAGKILILAMAVPIISVLLETIISLIPAK
ncbi:MULTISPECIES: stage III sporulation protein AD [Bacillus]|uniref:stage III sporulation protein AD n=1 Tax=Bacillus TaxID=1386 RepID=UPI0030C8F320